MRIVPVLFLAVVLAVGCQEGVRLPTAPSTPAPPAQPPSSDEVYLDGYVYDRGGRCLAEARVDATVEGEARPAVTTGCPFGAYRFKDLREGQKVTMRASKVGYVAEEREVTVSSDMDGLHSNVNFFLEAN
jgi:hypothetical protein